MRKLFANAFNSIGEYGLYVRGKYFELSGIDVLILVTPTEKNNGRSDEIGDIVFEYLARFVADVFSGDNQCGSF